MANEFNPNWVSPPGETIADLMGDRGLTLAQFAERLGQSIADSASLIDGFAPLTDSIAVKLEEIFGAPAQFWKNREAQYRNAKPD